MDEEADAFEYQIIDTVEQLLSLQGITGEDATPKFSRNRIANEREAVETVMLAASVLDEEMIITKLPILTPEERSTLLERKQNDEIDRIDGE